MARRIILDLSDPESWRGPIRDAAEILRNGGLVAFPTDTVYGLAADAFQPDAVALIYVAKGRPETKPVAWLVSDAESLARFGATVERDAERLMTALWPGPLTLILARTMPDGSASTQGVRMPDHPVALALIRECGGVLAVTSANLSGDPELLSGEETERVLGDRIPLVLDGGVAPGGSASTVVSLLEAPPRILRVGPISLDAIRAAMERAES